MRFFISFLLIFSMVSFSSAGVVEKDSLALIAFYDSTDGASWTKVWELDQPVSSWYGVTVENNRVTKLSFSQNNIIGSLPKEISNLDSLTYMKMYFTDLSGELPADIGNLTKLETVDFTYNSLSGAIPASFYNLVNLKEAILRNNQFSDSLSPDINKLTKLETLRISGNDLTGSFPSTIGDLPNLTYLDISSNEFSGDFPEGVTNLTGLTYLNLSLNNFTGSIPASIGNLVNVTFLRLNNNNFTGEVPVEIGNLAALTNIYLDNNDLEGAIPEEITNCSNLASLRAGGNDFTSLPDLSALPNLSDVWVPNNQFSGPFPDFFYSMTQIRTLNIYGNSYEGELKSDIKNWQAISHFYFGGNQLSGEIPKEIGMLKKVSFLELYSNNFSGEIPQEIGEMENLQYLRLYGNELTGEIPDEIGNAPRIKQIDLKQNQLTGKIPSSITLLEDLDRLVLSDNKLSAAVEFQSGSAITYIDVKNNKFTFEDIELLKKAGAATFIISPQDSALDKKEFNVPFNTPLILNRKIGGSSNHYKWFKDGSEIVEDNLTGVYVIESLQAEDIGEYHCEVTSDSVDGLTIYTSEINVQFGEASIDSLTLINLYYALGGAQWTDNTNWLSYQPISSWHGVTHNNGVTGLDLSNNNLQGELPVSISNLMMLESLNLSGNSISGTIPGETGQLNNLTSLDLSNNMLEGYVPDELVLIENLSTLNISHNAFTGLPEFVESSLTDLDVSGNKFTFGDLEKNLSAASAFTYVPQDSVGKVHKDTLDHGDEYEIILKTDGLANNYQWFKNGVFMDGADENTLTIESVTDDDAGSYVCMVTNNLVTGLNIYTRPYILAVNAPTALYNEKTDIPTHFALDQNYPNPFNPSTSIKYSLAKESDVKIEVFNMLGQRVSVLVNEKQRAGYHTVKFNAESYASGIYFYKMDVAEGSFIKKMLLVK